VEALHLKLAALMNMSGKLQPLQKREAGVTANVLLSLIDRIKKEVSPLPKRYSEFEAYAYYTHGRISLDERTEESARRAVAHFEKNLKVYEAIGDAEGIAAAKASIASAKSKYKGGRNDEELLKATQDLYKLRVVEGGEENIYTIHAGKIYALRLQKANRGGEARELLTKLLITSKRVLGPHHNTTKELEKELKKVVKKAQYLPKSM
jgi:copper chaperone CopZ